MMEYDNPKVIFTKRAVPIPVSYRPLYRVSQILLVLYICSRGGKASLLKLQLFLWGLKSSQNQIKFISLVSSTSNSIIWSLDPTVIRAVNYAIYENLVTNEKGGINLTTKGELFANAIVSENDVFISELAFLKELGLKITEQKINKLSKNWASQNA